MKCCSKWWTNDQIMPRGRGSFTNSFSRKLNTVNLKILADHGGITYLKIKSWPVYRIMEEFIFKFIMWEVSKVESHSVFLMFTLTWGIDLLFEKLTPQIRGWIWKTLSAYYDAGVGEFMESLNSLLISLLVLTCTLVSWRRVILDFAYLRVRLMGKVHFERCLLLGRGRDEELVQPEGK